MAIELDAARGVEESAERIGPVLGQSGLAHFSGYISEEFLPELRGNRAIKVYEEMRRNEPAVSALLAAITSIIQSVEWGVSARSRTGVDLAAKTVLEDSLESMRRPFDDVITDICSVFAFGWALFEIVYKLDRGRVLWNDLAFRSQDSLESWGIDENGQITNFTQRPAPTYKLITIPENKFLLFRTTNEKNNPEGLSLLRPAYKPWYFKKVIEEVEAIGAERDLIGIPVMTLPYGATQADVDKAKAIVERIKNDEQAGIVLTRITPSEGGAYEFKLVNGQGSSGKVSFTDRIIQRYSTEIQMAALAHFLRLGQASGGSYALSADQRDVFQLSVRGWMSKIRNTLNVGAERLLRMNGMDPKAAKFVHGRIGQLNTQNLVNFLTAGSQNGFLTLTREDENWLRKEVEMPVLPEGVEAASEKEVPAPAAAGGPDNSGLNANPGENQQGIFKPQAEGAGAVEGGGDIKQPIPLAQSKQQFKEFAVGQPRDSEGKWTSGGGSGAFVKTKAAATAALGSVFLHPRSVGYKTVSTGPGRASKQKVNRGNVDLEQVSGGWKVSGEGVKGKANFYSGELVKKGHKASAPDNDTLFLHSMTEQQFSEEDDPFAELDSVMNLII